MVSLISKFDVMRFEKAYNMLNTAVYSLKRSIITLIILLSVFVGSIVIENPDLPFSLCLFKTITGLPCPSCGMTHSFVSIGHLKIIEGFYYNILGPILYIGLLLGIVLLLIEIALNRLIIYPFFERHKRVLLVIVIPLVILSWGINLLRHFKVIY